MSYVPLRKACEYLGLHANTLRKYADESKIKSIRNEADQRLFDVSSYRRDSYQEEFICYCRVSSYKQKDDLQRQVEYMQEKFPKASIIKDIGSGINYKRKGLITLLDKLAQGTKLTIVVAYKDRLTRFGFELFEYLVEQNGGQILVLNQISMSPEKELTQDLLTILHVFSCRLHGLRNYSSQIKKDKNLSD